MRVLVFVGLVACIAASPLPQKGDEDLPPMPYEFSNKVTDPEAEENGIYWTQDEQALEDSPGRVDGSYSVLLPDGRLMTVSYYIDGDSGFVPTITFEENYTPDWEAKK
eukprot:TRINITY_DN9929_c0_g1_i2.p1 TRINITY_DN9929_c0_g1~~TRINITY_DN9929_c0_g1_i2.p1  ORF type:complete len:115 (-),score=24.23 TRINITY_DN9929_c0_g1_i2:434-757(-)